jgi:hypothetical protein
MAEMSGFFPDVNGDREYTADFMAQLFHRIYSNGVYDGDFAFHKLTQKFLRVR